MDDRGYLAEALFDRLSAEGVEHRVLRNADGRVEIAVTQEVLARIPQAIAQFARELDLRLVQLLQPEHRAWRVVLAWSDDTGRPRFIAASVFSDWCRGTRRLLESSEILRGGAQVEFIHALICAAEELSLPADQDERLSGLWQDDPRAGAQMVARFWRRPAEARLIGQAARLADWTNVRAALPALKDAMHRGWPRPEAALSFLGLQLRQLLQPERIAIAFIGRADPGRDAVQAAVARDLAPAFRHGLSTLGHGFDDDPAGVDVRIVFDSASDDPLAQDFEERFEDAILVDPARRPLAQVADIERAVLRWLEFRVERRYPRVVGDNPRAARLLQLACRARVPLLADALRLLLNCDLQCHLRSPILMPHPFGIVIERGTVIGSRVTVMQQATLGRKSASDKGLPVIEDNVCIGPGARVLGAVRIGRGATVGANAVVTRDVPSHCTVVGANRILGQEDPIVVKRRQTDHAIVVNT